MKCILCRICETARAAANKQRREWSQAHTNQMAIWEREAEQERIRQASSIRDTDPARSLKEYLALAEQGSVWSMICAGAIFEAANGPQPDLAEAEKWYRRAYENGADDALLRLGHLYLRSRQYQKAKEVFRTGVERGLAPAMYPLAWAYGQSAEWPQKREQAFVLLKQASAAGDLGAKHFLAAAMVRGWFGLRRIPDGFRLFSEVADDWSALIADEYPPKAVGKNEARSGLLGRLLPLLGAVHIPI